MSARERRRCGATTKAGKPCKRWALDGGELCASHAGLTGRASSLTEKLRVAIVGALRAGSYRIRAIEAAGIGESTFYRWLETGEADAELDRDTEHRKLWEGVKKAEAEAEVEALALIRKQAADYIDPDGNPVRGKWQAAAWLLERKYPERWGRRIELGGAIDVPSGGLDLSKLTDAQLADLRELMEAAKA